MADETPHSDPTPRTTAQLFREIETLKELLTEKDQSNLARLNAMDKAVELLQKFPTAIDIAVNNLKELHQEKFEGVGVRFTELNTRLTEGDKYKQTALDAALKAAQTLVDKQQENNKESIKKTEDLFIKQIDSIKETADDLKVTTRLQQGSHAGQMSMWLVIVGGIASVVGVISVIELVMKR